MASFEIADRVTRSNEGGWQNDPDDRGNDSAGHGTYRGIASKIHPAWKGWPIVSEELAKLGQQPPCGTKAYREFTRKVDAALAPNEALQDMVCKFYKANFWDVLRLDDFASQELANKLYDSAVNQGPGTAAMILQRILGVMPDGSIGPVTIAAANKRDGTKLAAEFKDARIAKYKALASARPDQAKYLSTWIARC
jgi:lysozyme family protein